MSQEENVVSCFSQFSQLFVPQMFLWSQNLNVLIWCQNDIKYLNKIMSKWYQILEQNNVKIISNIGTKQCQDEIFCDIKFPQLSLSLWEQLFVTSYAAICYSYKIVLTPKLIPIFTLDNIINIFVKNQHQSSKRANGSKTY